MGYEDYLKRQFDKLGQVLGKLLADLIGLKTQGKAEQGVEIVNQTLKAQIDIDIDQILSCPDEVLVEWLSGNISPDLHRIELIADILYEIAEFYKLNQPKDTAISLIKKVLTLYEYIDNTSSVFSFDHHSKTEKLQNMLQQINLTKT